MIVILLLHFRTARLKISDGDKRVNKLVYYHCLNEFFFLLLFEFTKLHEGDELLPVEITTWIKKIHKTTKKKYWNQLNPGALQHSK